ncbi:MAG: hypothetical protein ACK4F7_04470 [Inhella sp.]
MDGELFWQAVRTTIVNAREITAVGRPLRVKRAIKPKYRPETLEVSTAYAHRFK